MDALSSRIGEEARVRLAAARVGVAGLGGLGSHIAVMLARSGVGALHLVDFDLVDESTLDRVRVDAGNAAALFAGERIVCEAFDDPRCKADLVNALLTEASNTVVVAGSGMAGAGPADALVTRRVGRRLFVCGDGEADVADEALFAPRVALCAAQQALVVVRLVLGLEEN